MIPKNKSIFLTNLKTFNLIFSLLSQWHVVFHTHGGKESPKCVSIIYREHLNFSVTVEFLLSIHVVTPSPNC